MDKSIFKPGMPGRVVPIELGEHAFIPDPLPPNWDFPVQFWPLVVEAKQNIGLLEGIGRLLPDPAILLRPLEDREAIQSSALEGTYATPRELLLFELDPHESTSDRDPNNSSREVFNYRRALHHGTKSNLPITLRLLREMHEILLLGVRGHEKDPGNFRRIQVAIGSQRRFVPPPANHVPDCLDSMEKYIHSDSGFDPLIDCFLVHYQFETIHPFNDGNGRIGRLLLAMMMQSKCGMSKPWLYLSEYFEKYRDEYIQNLFRISTEAAWEPWIEFCLNATISQAKSTIARCEKLLAIRAKYQKLLGETNGNVRLYSIVEQIFSSPFVRVAELSKRLGISYPTAKADLKKLTEAGILRELPNVSYKTYYSPDVFRVSYEEISDGDQP